MNLLYLALAVAALLPTQVHAQTAMPWPTKPVTVVIGNPPGGGPDTALRQIAMRLSERLGQPVVVANHPGATGTIGASAVARALPDGHTLLFGVAGNLALAPASMKQPPYDPTKAFAPVIEVASGPYVWMVKPEVPARGMREFVEWAKQRPSQVNYASPGVGSAHHLATELLARSAGIEMQHVPFTAILPALLGGQVDAMFDTLPGPLPHLKAGKVRALAVTGDRRLTALPEVPTLAEQGMSDVHITFWWGFVAPAGTPEPIVARLNTELNRVLAEPEITALFSGWGIEISGGSAQAFGTRIGADHARWREFIARSGLKLE